jgi:hypothetical protein
LAYIVSLLFLTSDGQKLGQQRRSKRLQAKLIGIQDLDGGDTDSDIFEDRRSSSEDGKSGQSTCLSSDFFKMDGLVCVFREEKVSSKKNKALPKEVYI